MKPYFMLWLCCFCDYFWISAASILHLIYLYASASYFRTHPTGSAMSCTHTIIEFDFIKANTAVLPSMHYPPPPSFVPCVPCLFKWPIAQGWTSFSVCVLEDISVCLALTVGDMVSLISSALAAYGRERARLGPALSSLLEVAPAGWGSVWSVIPPTTGEPFRATLIL